MIMTAEIKHGIFSKELTKSKYDVNSGKFVIIKACIKSLLTIFDT
jgi:hypothetical protein